MFVNNWHNKTFLAVTVKFVTARKINYYIMQYKESEQLRKVRIQGTVNGSTLRTRVILSKKLYKRKKKVEYERN